MIDLPTQAQKFSVSPFTKGDDLRRFLKAAVKGVESEKSLYPFDDVGADFDGLAVGGEGFVEAFGQ
jgi:hypothetical protein